MDPQAALQQQLLLYQQQVLQQMGGQIGGAVNGAIAGAGLAGLAPPVQQVSSPEAKAAAEAAEMSNNLYMVGLPAETNEDLMKKIFCQYGAVLSVKVLPMRDGVTNAAALVKMGSVQEAKWLVDNVNNQIPQGLSSPVQIRFANQKGSGKGKGDCKGGFGAPLLPGAQPGGAPSIVVSGCVNPTVAAIVQGSYVLHSENHGCPVYQCQQAGGAITALIYFWDARDGPTFHGWWFGPKVGGDQVWAYNPDTSAPGDNWWLHRCCFL